MTNLSLRGILDILDDYQVTLRKNGETIEWKYNYEDNTAWKILIVMDEIRGPGLIDDEATELTSTWSSSKIDGLIGDIESTLDAIIGV
jgi:hypothetical protein